MAKEFIVKTMSQITAEGEKVDLLLWIGCSGSYDARAQKVSIAFSKLLIEAGIKFAILGEEENCCGDPARRAGNEFVFQMLALQNIEIMNGYGVKKVVTICPHGYNTIKNEYPVLGGNYEVLHHTQFLNQLIESGRLNVKGKKIKELITYHDSCYLARVNNEHEAPRNVLSAIQASLKEMPRSGKATFCCGAGGAQMFKEEENGEERINTNRAKEAVKTGCELIVANCPFCITMLEDGLKDLNKEKEIKVKDLAEILSEQIVD